MTFAVCDFDIVETRSRRREELNRSRFEVFVILICESAVDFDADDAVKLLFGKYINLCGKIA